VTRVCAAGIARYSKFTGAHGDIEYRLKIRRVAGLPLGEQAVRDEVRRRRAAERQKAKMRPKPKLRRYQFSTVVMCGTLPPWGICRGLHSLQIGMVSNTIIVLIKSTKAMVNTV